MNFLQNHAIFRSDQSNDMRYRNRKLTCYIKQKVITAEIYIYKIKIIDTGKMEKQRKDVSRERK